MLLAVILILIAAALCAIAYFRKDHSEIIGCGVSETGIAGSYTNNEGRKLFQQNCAACHHPLKDIVGPALANIRQRFPMQLLYLYIREPQKAIKESKYLRDLEKKYGMRHIAFPSLANAEIDSIIDYSNSYQRLPVP